ncbi:MAG: NADH-quinone oxidoreductase subunit A [Holophagaceae bacterium]|jgi:NADH-quinone oxidoreductase subunit A
MNAAAPFVPLLILALAAIVIATAVLVLSGVILPKFKPNNPQRSKLEPYECGVPPRQQGARHRYSVQFYLVAMLFILFDVETAFLFPWAANFKQAPETFSLMVLFLFTLLLGYVYALGKGALDWEK